MIRFDKNKKPGKPEDDSRRFSFPQMLKEIRLRETNNEKNEKFDDSRLVFIRLAGGVRL